MRFSILANQPGTRKYESFMPLNVPRYIRCYDNEESIDRYTVVFGAGVKHNPFVGMSSNPYHPQGVGMHGESGSLPIDMRSPVNRSYAHLGRKIEFADLPLACQHLVLRDYADIHRLDISAHPLILGTRVGVTQVTWLPGVTPWQAPRKEKKQ